MLLRPNQTLLNGRFPIVGPSMQTAPQIQHAGLSQVQHYTLNLPSKMQHWFKVWFRTKLNLSGLLHRFRDAY